MSWLSLFRYGGCSDGPIGSNPKLTNAHTSNSSRRNSTIPEEDSEGADANTACSASGETSAPRGQELASRPDYGDSESLENLSDEQRQHIKEVMKRAERSGQSAKIVMDSRRLRNVRGGRMCYNVEERDSAVSEEEEDAMIQMDPLPENIEITVGQFSCSSYASSEFSITESEQLERESLLERDISKAQRPSNVMADASITEEKRLSVMRSVQLLSHKISEWIKSLDEEDDYVSEARKKSGEVQHNAVKTSPLDHRRLDTYCTHLALNACIAATSQASRTQRTSHPRSPSKEEWLMIDEQARLLVASVISSALFDCSLLQWADKLTGAIWQDAMRSYVITLETYSPNEVASDVSSGETSGADEHSSTASAGGSIAEALTREELEHIANIQLLAEQDAFSTLPCYSPAGGSNPVLELAGEVERSQLQAPIPPFSIPPASIRTSSADKTHEEEADFFDAEERGLTQEELEHIERVARLAEEDALYATTPAHQDVGPSSESARDQLLSVSPPSTPTSSADEEVSSSEGSNLAGDIQLERVEQQVGAIEETKYGDGVGELPSMLAAAITTRPDSASTSSADEAAPSPASFDLEEQLRTLECEKHPPLMDGTLEQNLMTRSTYDGINGGLTEEEIRHIERIKQLADEDAEVVREFPFGPILNETSEAPQPEDGFFLKGAPNEESSNSTTTSGADSPAITGEVDAQFDWPAAEKDEGMEYSRPIELEHTMATPNFEPPPAGASSDSSTDTSGPDSPLESGAEIVDDGVHQQEPASHVAEDIIDHEVPVREGKQTPSKIKPTRPPPPARYAPSVGNQMRPKVSKILEEEDEIAYLAAESVLKECRMHHDIPSITYTMYDYDDNEEDEMGVDEAIRTGGVEEEDAMKTAAKIHTEKGVEEKSELEERPAADEFIRRSQIGVMEEESGDEDSGETPGADSPSTAWDADTFEIVSRAEEKDSETASPLTVAFPKIPPTPRRPPPPPPSSSVAQYVVATNYEAMKLTEEELQHIAHVEQRATSEVGSQHPVPLSLELGQAEKPLAEAFYLTEEELAHIAQVEQLAVQDSQSPTQPGAVVVPTELPNDQLPAPHPRFPASESEGHSSEEEREEFERVCAILEGLKESEADVKPSARDEQSHEMKSISSDGTSGPDSPSASATTATSIPASNEDFIAYLEEKNESTTASEHSSDEAEEEFEKVRMLLGEMRGAEETREMNEAPKKSSPLEISPTIESEMYGERERPAKLSGSSTEEYHEEGMTRPTEMESASLVKAESTLFKTGSTIAAMTTMGDGGSSEGELSPRDEGSVSDITSLADTTQQSPSIESADEELIDSWSIGGEEKQAAVPVKSPSVSTSIPPRWEADVSQQFHRAEHTDVPQSTSPSTPTEEGGSSVRDGIEALSADEVEVEAVRERPYVESPLTAEELEHIVRVQLLAEESWGGIEIPQVGADTGSHTEVNKAQSPTSRQRSYSSSTATSGPDEDGVVEAAEADRIKGMDSLRDQPPPSELISETERSSTATSGADEMEEEEVEIESDHESIIEVEPLLNRTKLSTAEEMSRPEPSSIEDHVSSASAFSDSAPSTISVSYTNVLREKGGRIWSSISGMEPPPTISPLDVPQTQPADTATLGEGEKVKVMISDERLRASFHDDTEEEEEEEEAVADEAMEEWRREEIEPKPTTPQIYHDAQRNAYVECERLGIVEDRALQENTDFLLALNFYAQRLAADVAEYAAYDISSIYSLQLNPRARYFGATDYYNDQLLSNVVVSDDQMDQSSSSTSNETPLEDESRLSTTLEETPSDYHVQKRVAVDSQHPSEGTASRIFSLFSRRRSSSERSFQSAFPFIQQSTDVLNSLLSLTDRSSSERKSSVASESAMAMSTTRRSSPGDILDLVNRRRSSVNSKERGASSSPAINLPAEALEGLSETEKQHILDVVAASYATTSGIQGADVVDYSPREMLLRSPDTNVRYGITEPIDANLEGDEQEHLLVQRGAQSRDAPFVLAGDTPSEIIRLEWPGMNEGEECLAIDSELEPTTQVRSAIEVDGQLKEPLEMDSAFLRPITSMEDVLQQEGITADEMEHIRRVMQMAEVEGMDISAGGLQPPLSAVIDQYKQQQSDYSPPTSCNDGEREEWGTGVRSEADSALGDSILTGLSDEEVEHIRRVTEMADKELSFSGPPPTSSEFWSIDAITEKKGEEDGDTKATKHTSRSNVFRRDRDEVGISNAAVASAGDSETDHIAQEVARLETELQKMNESLMAGDWDNVGAQQQGPSQVAASSPGSAEQRKPIINDGSDVSVVCVANIFTTPAAPTQIEKDVSALHSLLFTSDVSMEGKSGGWWEKEEVPHSAMAPAPLQHPMQLHDEGKAKTALFWDSRSWPPAPLTPSTAEAESESEEAVEWEGGRGGVGYVKETSREIAEVRIAKMDESELGEEDAKVSHLLSEKEPASMPLEGATGGRPIDTVERTLPPPSKPPSSSQPAPQHGIYGTTTVAAGSSWGGREGEWREGESGDTLLLHDYGPEASAPLSNPPTANTYEASQSIRLHFFEEGDDERRRLEPRWKCAAVIPNDGVAVTHSPYSITELPPHSPSTPSLPAADEPSQQEKERVPTPFHIDSCIENTSSPNASMSGFVKGGSTGSGGGGGFGGFTNRFGLSKLASDAIKGAKQASAELSAKATKAAQAAQLGLDSMQPPRPHASKSMTNLATPMTQSTPSPMPVALGLEDLSEEERAKILAVMQSAAMEEDASEGQLQKKLSASRTMDVLPSPTFVAELPQIESSADAQMTAGLSGLSEEEREKIKEVIRMAKEEEVGGAVPVMGPTIPVARVKNNKSATTLSRDLWEEEVPTPAEVGRGHLHHGITDDHYEEDEAVVTEFEEYPVGHSDEVVEDLEKYGKPVPTGMDIAAAPVSRAVEELGPAQSIIKAAAPTASGMEAEQAGQLRDEDDVWMEKSEYRAPDSWEAKSPSGFGVPNRMWTTDFSEDASEIFDADGEQNTPMYRTREGDENKERQVAAGGEAGPKEREDGDAQEPVITADTVRGCWEAPSFEEVQIQMEDPMSPLLASFPSMVVTDTRHVKPPVSMAPPEIVLTTAVDGEESDGTPPSSDGEEDYPDRVIEAPSEVNPSLTSFSTTQQKQERERAEQAAFARQVLQEIQQSFGEVANDEFDVQWARGAEAVSGTHECKSEQVPKVVGTRVDGDKGATPKASEFEKRPPSAEVAEKPVINPFLEEEEFMGTASSGQESDDETDRHHGRIDVVQHIALDEDDEQQQLTEAEQYYRAQQSPYFSHRPGPVYTIPESDEESSVVNTEGIYKARELDRKPLHTVHSAPPPLIPESALRAREKRARNSQRPASADHAATMRPPTQMVPVPVRTAPPPPDSATGAVVTNGNTAHKFTTDIPQPDDLFLPPHTHGGLPVSKELAMRSSTIGSCLETVWTAVHAAAPIDHSGAAVDANKLKRSPAMMLPSDESLLKENAPSLEGGVHGKQQQDLARGPDYRQLPSTTTTSPITSATSRGPRPSTSTSAPGEMGRRKLPPLPPTTGYPPPAYSISLAQQLQQQREARAPKAPSPAVEYKDASCNGAVPSIPAQQTPSSLFTSPLSISSNQAFLARSTFYRSPATNLLPASALYTTKSGSLPATSLGYSHQQPHPTDPAIIPGATFRILPTEFKHTQQRSYSSPQRSRISTIEGAATTSFGQHKSVNSTLSQVIFKKELRERLAEQRSLLEASDIEANNRRYMINRHLVSLAPVSRPPELEQMPAIVHCQLPRELVEGARVVPASRAVMTERASRWTTTTTTTPTMSNYSFGEAKPTTKMHSAASAGCGYAGEPLRLKRTVGVQSELMQSPDVKERDGGRCGIKWATKVPQPSPLPYSTTDSSTQTSKCAETQTSATAADDDRVERRMDLAEEEEAEDERRRWRKRERHLRRQQQYQRHFFTPNDSSPAEIEARRRRVEEELRLRRREQLLRASVGDLHSLEQDMRGDMMEPSSYRQPPHYNSLPRLPAIDAYSHISYPHLTFESRDGESFQPSYAPTASHQWNRRLGGYASLPRNYETQRGLVEDEGALRPSSLFPQYARAYGDERYSGSGAFRSMCDLRSSDPYLSTPFDLYPPPLTTTTMLGQRGQDDMYMGRRRFDRDGSGSGRAPARMAGDGMLSQYAHYLNQDLLERERRELEDPLLTDSFVQRDSVRQPMMPEPPLSSSQPQQLPHRSDVAFQSPSLQWPESPQATVYSRREENYGSCAPFAPVIGDYGNYWRNPRPEQHQPGVSLEGGLLGRDWGRDQSLHQRTPAAKLPYSYDMTRRYENELYPIDATGCWRQPPYPSPPHHYWPQSQFDSRRAVGDDGLTRVMQQYTRKPISRPLVHSSMSHLPDDERGQYDFRNATTGKQHDFYTAISRGEHPFDAITAPHHYNMYQPSSPQSYNSYIDPSTEFQHYDSSYGFMPTADGGFIDGR